MLRGCKTLASFGVWTRRTVAFYALEDVTSRLLVSFDPWLATSMLGLLGLCSIYCWSRALKRGELKGSARCATATAQRGCERFEDADRNGAV